MKPCKMNSCCELYLRINAFVKEVVLYIYLMNVSWGCGKKNPNFTDPKNLLGIALQNILIQFRQFSCFFSRN